VKPIVIRHKHTPPLHQPNTWPSSFRWIFLVICSMLSPEMAQATDLSGKLKTAYIANIVKFVTWPSGAKYIKFCLYSNSNIHAQSASLMNLPIGGNRRLKVISNPKDYTLCNLVYWDSRSIQHRNMPPHPSVLEISDMPNALILGMDIQLKIIENKMSFSIAQPKMKSSNFRISSKLLRLSKNGRKP